MLKRRNNGKTPPTINEWRRSMVKVTGGWNSTQKFTDNEIAEALIETGGVVSQAAEKLGAHHMTLRKRIRNSKKLKDLVQAFDEALVDMAENNLRSLVQAKDRQAIMFVLKSKGKERGWIETLDIGGVPDKPLVFKWSIASEKDRPKEIGNTMTPVDFDPTKARN